MVMNISRREPIIRDEYGLITKITHRDPVDHRRESQNKVASNKSWFTVNRSPVSQQV
jgi:hypothetical protein